MSDLIDRQAAIDAIDEYIENNRRPDFIGNMVWVSGVADAMRIVSDLPSVQEQRWIPVTERLPEELKAVNITWVNHEPEPYYHDIKDRNFVATGIYFHGHWYWYSTVCADYLGEYGEWDVDKVDDAVEIIAWMPLPYPYKGEE